MVEEILGSRFASQYFVERLWDVSRMSGSIAITG
jgi:hypothetical protein